jgi:hypothetical protein
MRCQRHNPGLLTLGMTLLVILFGVVRPAHALDQRSVDNLQAAIHSLSFLDSLPKEGPIVIGLIYSSDVPTSEALAADSAKVIGSMHGPNSRTLQPLLLSTNALVQYEGHLDVIFVVRGAFTQPEMLLDTVRRHHLVSISDDPACLISKCCVLVINTGQRVEISLNTGLADVVGARFSLVFTMVVKRI